MDYNKKGALNHLILSSLLQSGLLDSNQRPRAPQTCALPTAPNPELASAKIYILDDITKFSSNFLHFGFESSFILNTFDYSDSNN